MAAPSMIDVVIDEPFECEEEMMELFYPKVFVQIRGNFPASSNNLKLVPTLFHATHYQEMLEICVGRQAVFKGNKKLWRNTDDPDAASYGVNCTTGAMQLLSPNDDALPGNLLWFGTVRGEGKVYGPCEFEFNYKRVLQAYQACRGMDCKVCYKVGGTLVYQKEVSHVVIVCCTIDKCYEQFPSIADIGNSTRYFKFPSSSNLPQILVNDYSNMCNDAPGRRRHEHVILAFHLPGGARLALTNEINFSELKHIPHDYCVKSKGVCNFAVNPIKIDQEIEARWNKSRQKLPKQL